MFLEVHNKGVGRRKLLEAILEAGLLTVAKTLMMVHPVVPPLLLCLFLAHQVPCTRQVWHRERRRLKFDQMRNRVRQLLLVILRRRPHSLRQMRSLGLVYGYPLLLLLSPLGMLKNRQLHRMMAPPHGQLKRNQPTLLIAVYLQRRSILRPRNLLLGDNRASLVSRHLPITDNY